MQTRRRCRQIRHQSKKQPYRGLCLRAVLRGGGGGGGGTQKTLNQKWPKEICPSANFTFSQDLMMGENGGPEGEGGQHPCPKYILIQACPHPRPTRPGHTSGTTTSTCLPLPRRPSLRRFDSDWVLRVSEVPAFKIGVVAVRLGVLCAWLWVHWVSHEAESIWLEVGSAWLLLDGVLQGVVRSTHRSEIEPFTGVLWAHRASNPEEA